MGSSNSSVKGLTFQGKIEEFTENNKVKLEFATMTRKGNSKIALDTAPMNVYNVASDIAEAGSTDYKIVATGHSAKKGDTIRFLVTANALEELEINVKSISANEIVLDGVLSASITAADTFDILRPITPRVDSTGAAITSAAPLRIQVDSGGGPVDTVVLDDQATPSNTVPIPVRLYGVSGNINITSEDLNVQLSHLGANADSVQIGDGTEIALVNASGELQVRDDDANTDLDTIAGAVSGTEMQVDVVDAGPLATEVTLSAMSAKLPASLGEKAEAASMSVTLSTENEAILTSMDTDLSTLAGAVSGSEMQVDIVDIAGISTEVTLSALNGKFSSLGQKASAASAPVVLSSEQETILSNIDTDLPTLAGAVSGSELQVDLVGLGGAATEATLAAMSAKLPAALGQANKAGSMSVTIASDQESLNTNAAVVDFLDGGVVDSSSTNITTGAGPNLVASLAANVTKIQIIEDIGEFMSLKDGGGTVLAYLPLGGGEVEVSISSGTALHIASESGSTINVGKIAINFLG